MIDITKELNDAQRRAVVNYNGPSLVIAGAGSGKTRVITYRITYMLQEGILPQNILGLTFTNKASTEMKERIADLIQSKQTHYLTLGTFHSVFSHILRSDGHILGYKNNFTIYDTSDSLALVRSIIKELNLNKEHYKEKQIFSRISSAKNQRITAKQYSENTKLTTLDYQNKIPDFFRIYLIYVERTKLANAMDFDDLLLNTYFLFKKHPEILEKYQNRFHYILVDEFQDTNIVQYEIVKMLGIAKKNVCCVGDDAQSIYSFRGAEIANIIKFKTDFKARIFRLEQNYRSTQTIVNAANGIISKNENQIKKTVFSELEEGEKIIIKELETDFKEGEFIAQDIKLKSLTKHLSYNDFTILYRTNYQSRIFEDALRREGIPYVIYGNISFYQRKEIKDVLAYLYLILNPYDEVSLLRVINFPRRGIGNTSLDKIKLYALSHNLTLWDTISQIDKLDIALSSAIKQRFLKFIAVIKKYQQEIDTKNAFDIADSLIKELNLINEYKNNENDIDKAENIEELLTTIYDYISENDGDEENDISLAGFLENIALITDLDKSKNKDEQDVVKLMTIHTAKGLEFKQVYIVGMEENLFPSFMSVDTLSKLEEERRLFYVAVTRAMENLTITYCNLRYKYNSQIFPSPSRFLKEIDSQYLDLQTHLKNSFQEPASVIPPSRTQNLKPLSSTDRQPNDTHSPASVSDIKEGMSIVHKKFGEGTVISIIGVHPDTKAIISFKTAGKKTLLLKFAKLTIIPN